MKRLNTNRPQFIDSFSMNELINEIESISDNEIEVSWNSFGGSLWAGWQFADFMQNTDKKISARVTGLAASMGGVLLAYFDKVTGTKQADVMLHSVRTNVSSITDKSNTELYNVLKSKIDEQKFKEVVGEDLKTIMFLKGEERKDIWITGEQAFEIGLFDELIDLTPDEVKNSNVLADLKLAASLDYELPENYKLNINQNNNNNNNHSINQKSIKMDVTELKAKHPEVFAQVFDSGKTAGVSAEKDRVNTWLVFNDLDSNKVKAGIESGEVMKKAEEVSFLRASQNAALQASLEDASAGNIAADKDTGKVKTKPTAEEKAVEAAFDEFGIEKEAK